MIKLLYILQLYLTPGPSPKQPQAVILEFLEVPISIIKINQIKLN